MSISWPKTMATKISHKVQEYRIPPLIQELFLKKKNFSALLKKITFPLYLFLAFKFLLSLFLTGFYSVWLVVTQMFLVNPTTIYLSLVFKLFFSPNHMCRQPSPSCETLPRVRTPIPHKTNLRRCPSSPVFKRQYVSLRSNLSQLNSVYLSQSTYF